MRQPKFATHGMHKCGNCDARVKAKDLLDIEDIGQRLTAGDMVPSGECPDCGALCYPASGNDPLPATVVVTVSGGTADAQVLPPNGDVRVILIDFDDLEDPETSADEIRELLDQVKQLPGNSKAAKAFRKNQEQALREILRKKA